MHKLLAVVCIISLYSCASDKKKIVISEGPDIHIDIKNRQHQHSIDSLIGDIQCVRLEDTGKAKLSGAQGLEKAIFRNDTVYILDKGFSSIKAYNSTGKYLFNVGGPGLTGGEYLRVEDMVYNPVRNTLWVLCNNPRKIVEYSLDGHYLRKINIKFFASAVGIVSSGTFYYYANQNNSEQAKKKNLLLTDSNNTVVGREFDFLKDQNFMLDFTGGIFETNGKLFFNPPYTGAYYLLGPDKVEKSYTVDLGENSAAGPGGNVRPCLGKSFIESDEYVIFNYMKNGIPFTGVYDTKNKNVYTNDMSFCPINFLFNSKVMAQDNKDVVLFLEPKYLQDILKRNESTMKQRFPDAYEKLIGRDSTTGAGITMVKLKLKHV